MAHLCLPPSFISFKHLPAVVCKFQGRNLVQTCYEYYLLNMSVVEPRFLKGRCKLLMWVWDAIIWPFFCKNCMEMKNCTEVRMCPPPLDPPVSRSEGVIMFPTSS